MVTRQSASLVLCVLLLASACSAEQERLYESFEAGIPDHWTATRPGSLSLSELHYKHGSHSLRWDWRGGEAVTARHDLGDLGRTGGYGGYSKATFVIWLYNSRPIDAAAIVSFLTGDEAGGWFEFPLGFTGWRRAALHYRWGEEFNGEVAADADAIRITAPHSVDSGTLFIDLVVYNGLLDYRLACIPAQAFMWQPVDPDEVEVAVERPDDLTDEQLAALERVAATIDPNTEEGFSYTEEYMAERADQFAAFNVRRTEQGVVGVPLVPNPGVYETAGVPYPPPTPSEMATWMREIAAAYHRTTDKAQRQQIADWYTLLSDHLADQGFMAGSGNAWGGYAGRRLADAMFWMRNVMRQRGRGEREAAFFDYNWGVSRILDANAELHVNLDRFGISEPRRLMGALLRLEPTERYQWVACFSDLLSREILCQGRDGFKPDGSAYHHGAHYFAYGSYCIPVLMGIVDRLDDTPFEVAPQALTRLRSVLMNLRFYANLLDVPVPMHGRHPFHGGEVRASMYRTLALSGPGAGEADFDAEVAAAHLRLLPEPPEEDPFPDRDISPEPPPQGNLAMNYAGISAHRRGDWLVAVHGYGKYFWGTEIYANVNAFGGYIGAGDIYVLTAGDPISLEGSGYVADGWDWSRFDGTTVVYLPIDQLRNPKNGTVHPRTDHTFVGGLSHRGRDGCFVMQTQGPEWLAPGLRAKKTCFLIDDRIICLGSGITADDPGNPVQTNLFQRHLRQPDLPVIANGEPLTGLGVERSLPADRTSWLIDTVGTGFLIPAGQSAHVARTHQRSRDPDDEEDTEGDFATAWLDHGLTPASAGYEYAIIPRATPERLQRLAAALDAAPRPWEVLQQDERAHILRDRDAGLVGLVLFEAGEVQPELPVAEVDRPCMLMLEPQGHRLWLTVCDPDLNLVEHVSQPRTLEVTLRGAWRLAEHPSEVRLAQRAGDTTVLQVTCHDGFSFTAQLSPAAGE
ncbi:MAG: chondroitinase family polysaccharide lyase [Armatimonadota bacterium]|nr:chondroitinase family polysaccharide lyase [Armatimonadota bacterium]